MEFGKNNISPIGINKREVNNVVTSLYKFVVNKTR